MNQISAFDQDTRFISASLRRGVPMKMDAYPICRSTNGDKTQKRRHSPHFPLKVAKQVFTDSLVADQGILTLQ